jgi:hypothetical protein
LAIAGRMLAQVPKMVPVYGHRYLPGQPHTFGHPVLSMWQTDIIRPLTCEMQVGRVGLEPTTQGL